MTSLFTPAGRAALALASDLAGGGRGGDPLAAAEALRRQGVPPDLAAAALTQVDLRGRAAAKFGADASRMYFTRAGLEQATRAPVAARRALRLAAAGVTSVADLGCGIGADTIAFARAGIRVRAVESDPGTVAVAAANAAALGLAGLVEVRCADARDVDLAGVDAVFCDPARRRGTGRVFDPRAWSPPWSFVAGLVHQVPRTVLKLAPGVGHDLIPQGAEAEWVSVDGDVVEAAFWCGPLASAARRATLLPSLAGTWAGQAGQRSSAAGLTGSGAAAAPVGPVRRYLYEPDGAVVRAHLVAEFAATVDGNLADADIAYVYSDTAAGTPFGRRYEVLDVLPFSVKRLRAALRARDIGRLTVKKRGSPLDPDEFRKAMRLDGTAEATVVLTRVAGAPTALLVNP